MKKLNIVVLSLIFGQAISCQNNHSFIEKYRNSISIFPNDLTSHFPLYGESNFILNTNIAGNINVDTLHLGFAPLYVMSAVKYTKSEFYKELDLINNLNPVIVNVNDTSVLLIAQTLILREFGYYNVEGYDKGEKSKEVIEKNRKKAGRIPIPVFNLQQYYSETASRLSTDFEILVIDFKPQKVIKINSGEQENFQVLPNGWEHGYSRGFAASNSKQIIIYWIIAW